MLLAIWQWWTSVHSSFLFFYCFSVHHLLPFHLARNEFNRRLPEIDCLLLQETQVTIMERVDGKCRTRWQIFEAGFMQFIPSRRKILTNSIKVLDKKMRLLYHIVSAMKNGLKNDNVSWHLSSVLKMQNSVKYLPAFTFTLTAAALGSVGHRSSVWAGIQNQQLLWHSVLIATCATRQRGVWRHRWEDRQF